MIFDIVIYNKKYVNYGIRLIYLAIFLILISFIPAITSKYGSEILFFTITFLTFGVVIENYFTRKVTKIGELIIEKEYSIINYESSSTKITNLDFKLNLSEESYKGESNHDLISGTGMFSVHSGVVLVSFINDIDNYSVEIVIPNKHYLRMLIELAKHNFKNSSKA